MELPSRCDYHSYSVANFDGLKSSFDSRFVIEEIPSKRDMDGVSGTCHTRRCWAWLQREEIIPGDSSPSTSSFYNIYNNPPPPVALGMLDLERERV
ncbi:hypothetical protein D8674_027879 [Pyrus ussuriensis x Pyrus communis]|uniref:Uncharacterized protein n=1 Tax=Pyrus ussuriensis x Pyrus communis TaxID=2448454 RepID=A0A5N5IAZ9_9ROSA|nr:hypothetical protein D8674_027879 [Pyrus ussuriensis x Pyrus communis]